MKKLLVVWLFFFSALISVEAETFYSNYSDYSEYSDEKVEDSDIVEVKTERRYKWYQDNKILGAYYPLSTNVSGYPEVDTSDFCEGEFSDWSINKPTFKNYRVIETREVYEYKDLLKARYIHFYNVRGGNLSIGEIEIFNQDQKIDYDIINDDSDFSNRLHDGKYDDFTNTSINNRISIYLKGEYDPKNIVIKIYLYDTTEQTKYVNVKFTNEANYSSYSLANLSMLHWFNCSYTSTYQVQTYEGKDYAYKPVKYSEPKYSEEKPEEQEGRIMGIVTQYRYKDTLFRYYRIDRVYCDGYFKENPGNYQKDENNYKDFYSYRIRDKVVIDDNLVFDNYDRTLNDLILETTTNDIKIMSEFNIHKNGEYQVKFVLPFQTITKIVKVDILDNQINEVNDLLLATEKNLKEKRQELKQKKHQLSELKEELEKLKTEDVDIELIKQYEQKVGIMEMQVSELINKINQLDQAKKNYNDQLETLLDQRKKQDIDYSFINYIKYWLWLIILILIIIITYHIIKTKKMSYQN